MSSEEIFERIQELIVDQLGVDADSVTMDSDIIDDLNADSLDVVDFIVTMESEFDMSIPDEEAQRLKTIGDAVEYIEQNS